MNNNILVESVLLLLALFVLAEPYPKSEGTDSIVCYIQEAYGNKQLPADLDTLIHHYTAKRLIDSINLNYYDMWNSIFQAAVNNAKKNHPNTIFLNDSIFNDILIRGFAGKKYGRFINDGGLISWMGDFGLNISPVLFGKVPKPADLRKNVWKRCKYPNLETFSFNCRAFGPPDSLPDSLPYNTTTYKAIAGDSAAQRMVFDSISKLTNPKDLFNAMLLLGYIGTKKAMQKCLEYFPDSTYIAEKMFIAKNKPEIIQKTSIRKAIIEALAYNNPDTVPDSFLRNYRGSDNWYQKITDTTSDDGKRTLRVFIKLEFNYHCYGDGPYYPTRLITDLQNVATWASKRYDCKVEMPKSDYKKIPLICIGGYVR
jgi:hypothetical protein